MGRTINHIELSPTLGLTECTDGWWLYDETRGMNLSMCAKTPQDAFIKALTYYQNRLTKVETEHKELRQKVDAFVSQFVQEDDD